MIAGIKGIERVESESTESEYLLPLKKYEKQDITNINNPIALRELIIFWKLLLRRNPCHCITDNRIIRREDIIPTGRCIFTSLFVYSPTAIAI